MRVLCLLTVLVVLGGCQFRIPVNAEGQPTGEPAAVTWSASGDMEAVAVDPEGVETPVEVTAAPDMEAVSEAVGAGTALLPFPWNILGSVAVGGLALLGKKKDK